MNYLEKRLKALEEGGSVVPVVPVDWAAVEVPIINLTAETVTLGGDLIFDVPSAPVADGDLTANQISFWSNDTINLLGFKMKNSSGVIKTGTIALT